MIFYLFIHWKKNNIWRNDVTTTETNVFVCKDGVITQRSDLEHSLSPLDITYDEMYLPSRSTHDWLWCFYFQRISYHGESTKYINYRKPPVFHSRRRSYSTVTSIFLFFDSWHVNYLNVNLNLNLDLNPLLHLDLEPVFIPLHNIFRFLLHQFLFLPVTVYTNQHLYSVFHSGSRPGLPMRINTITVR